MLIEDCVIPEILRHVTCCNYTKKNLLEWFWSRLIISLKAPLDPTECKSSNQSDLNSVSLDTSSSVSCWSSSGSSSDSSSSSSVGSSVYSSSSMSESSSGSTSDVNRSTDYLQPTPAYPVYLELLANSPPSKRKSNDYERISNVRQATRENNTASGGSATPGQNSSNYTQPITSVLYKRTPSPQGNRGDLRQQDISPLARNDQTSQRNSPAVNRRPVPPIPTENPRKATEQKEYFC